jgi:hypothetical protein
VAELLLLEFSHPNAAELYQAVNQDLGIGDSGAQWPGAMGCHVAGQSGDNLVVVEVWDSKAEQEEFMQNRLGPALQKANAPAPRRVEWLSLLGDMHR